MAQQFIHEDDNYRLVEKVHLMSLIEPGSVVQVCGPPMVGKSTLVNQVEKDWDTKKRGPTIFYHIMCKNLNSITDFFTAMLVTLTIAQFWTEARQRNSSTADALLSVLSIVAGQRPDRSHVFVFHKCEGLHSPPSDLPFLTFITSMADLHMSRGLKVSVVMTTYKKFHISGRKIKCAEIGMLTDPIDILCLLRRHAPGVNVVDYVNICLTTLCLPEAVIQLSQRYLSDRDNVQSLRLLQSRYPGSLEEIIFLDAEFFCQLFNARTDDVKSWVTQRDLELLAAVGQSSFTEGQLWACFRNFHPVISHAGWRLIITKLMENYVIREVPGTGQLAVHPLVVYYIHRNWPRVRMYFTNEDVSRNFMSHVILKTEENMRKHGRKGQLYGCHVQDWPVIQHQLQAAMHCQSYRTLLQVAVMGRNLIISCYPNESRQFYSLMYHSAKMIGSPSEEAVMEICLAQAIISGKDVDGPMALKHIDSAIETLQLQGPDFFYKTALRKKAKILESLGDHLQSIEFYRKAKEKYEFRRFTETNEALHVTDIQIKEENVSAEIQEIIPLIFTGNNTEAKEKLMELFENIQDRYEDHPEYADILNAIGLTTQRGSKDVDDALFWYKKSHKERKKLERICPQLMLRTFNNMAMILCRKGNTDKSEKYLLKALDILKENEWYQYYTALTLTHLSEVKVKQRDFQNAFDVTLQAENIIKRTTKYHDFRLKINQSLLHHRVVLGQTQSNVNTSVEDYIAILTDLGGQAKNYLSDDGHHYLMSAYEHGMFLHLDNSEDKFNYYKRNLFAHVEENVFLKDVLLRKNLRKAPSSLLSEHREFLEYLAKIEYKDHTFEKFLSLILRSCPFCRNIREVSDISVWTKEIDHLNKERLKPLNDISEELSLLSNFTPISSNLPDVIYSPEISSSDKVENVSHPHVNNPSVVDKVENISSSYVNSSSVIDKVENKSSSYVNNPSVIDKVENKSSSYVNSSSVIDKVENKSSSYVNNPYVIDKVENKSSSYVSSSSVIDKVENKSSSYVKNPYVIDKVENKSSSYVSSSSVIDKVENKSSFYVNNPSVIDKVENKSSSYVNNPSVIDKVENKSSSYVNNPSAIDKVENKFSSYVNSQSVIDKVENISSPYVNNSSVDNRNVSLSSFHVNNLPVINQNKVLASSEESYTNASKDKKDNVSSPHVNNPSNIDKAENVSNHLANYSSGIKQTYVLNSPQVKNPSTIHETRENLPQSFNDTPTPDISCEVVDPSDDDSVTRSMNHEVINLIDVNNELSNNNNLEGSQSNFIGELFHSDIFTLIRSPQTSDFSELLPPLLLRQLTEESGISVSSENNYSNSDGFDFSDLDEQLSSFSLDKSDDLYKFVSEMSCGNDDAANRQRDDEPDFEIGAHTVNTSTRRSLTLSLHENTHLDASELSTQCKTSNHLPESHPVLQEKTQVNSQESPTSLYSNPVYSLSSRECLDFDEGHAQEPNTQSK